MDSNENASTTDGIASRRSRRAVLSLGAAGIVSTLAGCSSIAGQSTPGTSPSNDGVFTDISFEGSQMVVELVDEHSVERLNLIGPDGSRYSTKKIAAGATQTGFKLMDIQWGLSGYEHYAPGEYEIVAVENEEAIQTHTIELEPSIEIDEVGVITLRETDFVDTLEVSVTNKGTGPTWIYDIAFPSIELGINTTLRDNPGIPQSNLVSPESAGDVILVPRESQKFVSRDTPFQFQNESVCNGRVLRGEVVAGTPVDSASRKDFEIELSGEAKVGSAFTGGDEYYCTNATAQLNTDG